MDLRKAVCRAGRAQYRMGGRRGILVTFWTVGACASDAAYNLAYCLQNRQDAEDAVQDAYVRAFRAFDAFIQAVGVGIFETDLNRPRTRISPGLVPPAGGRKETVSDVHHRSIFRAARL